MNIDFPKKPTKTVQSALNKTMFDREIEYMIFKNINGNTSYDVEILTQGLSEETLNFVKGTLINHLNIHGCFDPNDK